MVYIGVYFIEIASFFYYYFVGDGVMAVSLDKKTGTYMFYGSLYKDGKCIKRYKKRGFETKWEAQAAEVEYRKDFFMLPKDMTFDRLYKAFREYNTKYVKESTIKSDQYLYNVLSKEMKDIDFLDKIQMQKLIDKFDDKFSKSYVSRIYFFLSKLYKFGMVSGYIKENPMTYVKRDLRLNERKIEMTIWQQNDFNKFIENVDKEMYRCFFMVLFYMGLRKGEAMALQWKDIDFRKNTIDINKTFRYKEQNPQKWLTPPKTNNSYRIITMPNILSESLKKWQMECFKYDDCTQKMFVFGYYKPISPNSIQRRFDEAYKETVIKYPEVPKIRIHDFRHSHASFLINNMAGAGFSDFDIAKRLGDTVETLHNTYAHWFDTKDKSIVDMMNNLL